MSIYKFKEADALRFAEEGGYKTFRKGSELVFRSCPYCGSPSRNDKEKFSINLVNGQFQCFRASCGAKGNMLTLSRDFQFSLGQNIDEYYEPRKFTRYKMLEKPIEPTEPVYEYMKKRGISSEVVKRYELGEKEEGDALLIIFPFYDEKGRIQFIKYRNPAPKEGQSKEFCQTNCKPILFGMKQCHLDNKTLIITEGQIDSLSVAEAGIENAVSVPTGANGFTWVPYCWDWMQNFEKIIVFGDHENGHITLYKDIAARWRSKVWHVREEDYLDCKDANEILLKYGAEQIRRCVFNAVQLPVSKAKDLSEVAYINPYDIEKLPTGIAELDRCLCGGLPFGQLVLITGKAGDGKSTFASQLLLNALDCNCKVFAYSGELPNGLFRSWMDYQAAGTNHLCEEWSKWSQKATKRVRQDIIPKLNEWYKGQIWVYDNTVISEDDDEGLLDLLERVINQYGVRVILIDNLMTGLDLERSDTVDKYEKQSLFMKKLARMALQFNVLIMLVAHKRKDTGSTLVNDSVSGSADITNLASIVLSYERSKKDGNGKAITDDQRLLKVTKNRLFGNINTEGFTMSYDPDTKRIYMTHDELVREYTWEISTPFDNVIEPPPF